MNCECKAKLEKIYEEIKYYGNKIEIYIGFECPKCGNSYFINQEFDEDDLEID